MIVAGFYRFTLVVRVSVFSFPKDIGVDVSEFSPHDIVEIWFGIASGQISSVFFTVAGIIVSHFY